MDITGTLIGITRTLVDICLTVPPSPLNQILMNKLYNNALFMRSQNPQKKFLHLFCLAKKNFFCGDAE